jgi:hypothetical protein
MTARQFLAFQSAKSTAAKFRRHRLLFAANEWLVEQTDRLNLMIARVTRLAREQAAASTGLTVEQGKARQDLADTLVEVCGLGEGWAASVGNERLRTNLTVTATGLAALGLRIEVVAPTLLTSLREASALGASRSGVTTEVLDALGAQIDRLIASSSVRDLRDERKSATQELSTALLELMTFLRDVLDPAMRSFQRREPRFFEEYRNSRRVGGRKAKEDEAEDQEQEQGQEEKEAATSSAATKAEAKGQSKAPAATPVVPAAATPPATTQVSPVASTESQEREATRVRMKAEGLVEDQDAAADAELEKVLGEQSAAGSAGGGADGVTLSA